MIRVYVLHTIIIMVYWGKNNMKQKRNKKLLGIVFCIMVIVSGPAAAGHLSNNTWIKDNVENYILLEKEPYSALLNLDGNTLYVGGSGPNNYTTIQSAINDSADGYTVFVYDDSSPYNENILIEKTINLIGENKQTTILDGQGNGDTIHCEADNIQIHGFTIKNGYKPGGHWWIAGIQLDICDFCEIYDNTLINNYYGIRLYGAENCTVTSNTISSNKNMGVWLHDHCHNSEITNNIIENNEGAGINIEGTHYSQVVDNLIRYNPWDGIRLDHAAYTTISNNEICENGYNAIMMRSSYENIVINNDFTKNGLLICQVYLVDNTVENNFVDGKPLVYLTDESDKIIDNAGQVILLRCNRITVKDLHISNIFYGIQTYTCNDCTITNNILNNNFGAIYIGYDYPEVSVNLKITKNAVTENQRGIMVLYGENAEISENIVKNNLHSAIDVSGKNYEISKNTIKSNSDGIYVRGSKHTITQNVIEENMLGIYADELTGSLISSNDIKNNENGIYLYDSQKNIISKNNIHASKSRDAFFRDSLANVWRRNYWNQLIGPKIIRGVLYIIQGTWSPPRIVPVFWFDFRPARTPYDITNSEVI